MCDSNGQIARTEMCGFGCAAAGDTCLELDPSNHLAAELDGAAAAPAVTFDPAIDMTIIDTDTGVVMHGGVVLAISSVVKAQLGLPDIRIFQVKSLVIQNPVTILGSRALAIVSDGDVEISSPVTLFCQEAGGPGAVVGLAAGCSGKTPDSPVGKIPGSGGAGFGSAGGDGGAARDTDGGAALGGAGGSVTGDETLVPLRGGCSGGGGSGGGGGGALQISSRTRIRVTAGGVIDAGGGGGHPAGGRPGGGGSGGGILLEASVVSLAGTVAANGGGGACVIFGQDGQSGRVDDAPAKGGFCASSEVRWLGDGGAGGARDSAAEPGGSAMTTVDMSFLAVGGGGGGSVGRIRVNTRTGTFTQAGSAARVSPAASTGIARTRGGSPETSCAVFRPLL